MDLLQNANEPQRQAITSQYGPVAIIAGPGTGKTKTLATRIAYMLQQGVAPDSIVALTFTNKAAKEMRERVQALIGDGRLPQAATFHALCLSILQEFQPDRSWQFASDAEHAAAIDGALKKSKQKDVTLREASLRITRAKGSVAPDVADAALVQAYNESLHEQGLIDFDDLLADTHQLLQHDQSMQQRLRARYRHMLIDEFQDTSELQWRLVRLLCGSDSVFVIGDPKQSIYGFRGATQDMFAMFQADFPSHRRIVLDINYRSSPEIVRLGNEIFPKEVALHPHQDSAGLVQVMQTLNEFSEADAVVAAIEQGVGGTTMLNATVSTLGRQFRDFVILYRTHHMAKVVQRRLHDSGIPYQVVGEGSPYERPAIRAVVDSLKWLIGRDQLPQVKGFKPKQVQALLEKIAVDRPVSAVAEAIIKGLALAGDDPKKAQLLSQFVSTLVRFDARPDSTARYLAYFDELSQQEFYDPHADVVTLMTIHASKGLEFTHVFLLAAEEGRLPFERVSGPANIDEERRLFYVAVTRAKQHVHILYAKKRAGEQATMSRFVEVIPEDILPRTIDPGTEVIQKRLKRREQKARQTSLF